MKTTTRKAVVTTNAAVSNEKALSKNKRMQLASCNNEYSATHNNAAPAGVATTLQIYLATDA